MDIPVEHARASFVEPIGSNVMRIGQIGRVLRRYSGLIGGLAVIGGVAGYAYALSLPKSYTSSATLAVEGDSFAIPALQGALRGSNAPDPMPLVRTELQALTSRTMIQQVATQLDLVRDPEFNPALQPPTLFGRVKDAVKGLLSHKTADQPVDANEAVLSAANHALNAFQDNRSLVIDVAFTAHDPDLAAKFINTLIADYLATRAHWRDAANQGANSDMTQRIALVRSDLSGIEQKMRDLRAQSGVVGLRAGTVGQQQLEELATAADRATLDRANLEANWQRATALAKQGDSDALASVLGSETISRLREQESVASSRIADLSTTHGANYPGVRSARSNLAAIRSQMSGETQRIVASLGAQVQVARAHEADVKKQLADARDAAVASQNTEAELTQLQADATSQRQLYQHLLEQAQQAVGPTGKAAAAMPDVRVLSNAVPSGFPSAPNMKMTSGLGLVGGGILGCLLAFLRMQREDGFADAETLGAIGGLPVAATLPRSARGRRGALLSRIASAPGGPEAEALRLLRARLRTLARSQTVRSITFTSIGGDASAIATAFARVAASDGERVLLAEGDLRNPSMGKLLNMPNGEFDRALRGDEDWRDIVDADEATTLDVLTAGASVNDGASLMASVAFQNLLMEARDDYGLVVLTSPPADDAAVHTLAQRTDATVLVVDGRNARRADVREQSQHLSALSRNPVIAVLVAPA